jgi:hypothetical protein
MINKIQITCDESILSGCPHIQYNSHRKSSPPSADRRFPASQSRPQATLRKQPMEHQLTCMSAEKEQVN